MRINEMYTNIKYCVQDGILPQDQYCNAPRARKDDNFLCQNEYGLPYSS